MISEFVIVGDSFERADKPFSIDSIKRAVAKRFNVRALDIDSPARHKSVAFARHVAMYLVRSHCSKSYPEIARAFGRRNHTTVMSAVRKVRRLIVSDSSVATAVDELERLARFESTIELERQLAALPRDQIPLWQRAFTARKSAS